MNALSPAFVAALALLAAGCETPASPGSRSSPTPEQVIRLVKVNVDSRPWNARLLVNDDFVGQTPRDIHLEVDERGNLLSKVDLIVEFPPIPRPGLSPAPVPSGHASYPPGSRPPARLMFDGVNRIESGGPAPLDSLQNDPPPSRRR